MASAELDSFVAKFKSLLLAGKKAKLTVNANAGQAIVTLEVNLSSESDATFHRKHRPPSYYRRQEKRREQKRVSAIAESNNEIFTEPVAEKVAVGTSSSASTSFCPRRNEDDAT